MKCWGSHSHIHSIYVIENICNHKIVYIPTSTREWFTQNVPSSHKCDLQSCMVKSFDFFFSSWILIRIVNEYGTKEGIAHRNENGFVRKESSTYLDANTCYRRMSTLDTLFLFLFLLLCERNKYILKCSYGKILRIDGIKKRRCKILHMLQLLSNIDIWFYVWYWLYFYHHFINCCVYFCLQLLLLLLRFYVFALASSNLDMATS